MHSHHFEFEEFHVSESLGLPFMTLILLFVPLKGPVDMRKLQYARLSLSEAIRELPNLTSVFMPLATGSVKPVFEEGLEEFPLNMSVSRFSTEDSLKFCPAPVGATKEEFSYGYSGPNWQS